MPVGESAKQVSLDVDGMLPSSSVASVSLAEFASIELAPTGDTCPESDAKLRAQLRERFDTLSPRSSAMA